MSRPIVTLEEARDYVRMVQDAGDVGGTDVAFAKTIIALHERVAELKRQRGMLANCVHKQHRAWLDLVDLIDLEVPRETT